MAALLLTTLLTAALAAVPCLGAAAEETAVNLSETENLQTDKGELVGTTYNGNSQIYENELLQMIEDADGSLTIQVMKYGLNIPASVLQKALEQEKKLIIEIFQPGYDAAMFNSRWVFDPARVYWSLDTESYPLGINLDLDAPYYSGHPDSASNPLSSIVSGDGVEWSVYDMPEVEGQEGWTIPGFYVEVAQRGEFDGMERMPLYGYDKERGIITQWGYASRGDDAVVSDSIVWHTIRIDSPSWGTSYAVLSDEHNYLPVQEIQEQIRDENVSSIEVQEGTCYLDNQYVLPAEILDQLCDSGKTLFFTSPGVEAQPIYSWFFDGTEITDTTDIDLHVQFYEGPYNNTQGLGLPSMLQGLPGDVPSMLFDFAHSGIVPGGTTLSVTASAELAKEGYLYYVNEEDGTFEYIGQTSAEIENEYFCTLNVSGITHCSYYLVTARELTGDNVVVPGGPSEPGEPDDPLPPDTPEDTENSVETDQPAGTDNSDGQAVQDVQVEKVEQSGAAVQTGDNTPVLLAAFAAVLSLTAVIAVLRKKL